MYGLQFDLDSNRLVGLQTTGGLVWDDDLIRRSDMNAKAQARDHQRGISDSEETSTRLYSSVGASQEALPRQMLRTQGSMMFSERSIAPKPRGGVGGRGAKYFFRGRNSHQDL